MEFLLTNNAPTVIRNQVCRIVFSAYWETPDPLFAVRHFVDLCSG
jgi:hypothetical protein